MTIEIEYIKGVLFIRINGSIDKNSDTNLYTRAHSILCRFQK